MEMLGSGASAEISQPATSAVATAAVDQTNDFHRVEVSAGSHLTPTSMTVCREARLLSGLMFLIRPSLAGMIVWAKQPASVRGNEACDAADAAIRHLACKRHCRDFRYESGSTKLEVSKTSPLL